MLFWYDNQGGKVSFAHSEWPGMAANGWEWLRMDGNGCEWMGMAANGWEWL
jgi:hypothetical protein